MGLLLLIAVGAVFGWLASIISRTAEDGNDINLIASGVASATAAGFSVYDGSLLTGLSPEAFVAGALASAIVVATIAIIRDRRMEGAPTEKRR